VLRHWIAALTSLLVCVTGAWGTPPLAPTAGVVRLGPSAGAFAIDRVTRPLAAVDAPFEIALAAGTSGVLRVAAGLVPPVSAAAVCEVTRGAGGAPLASLALDRRTAWVEAEIVLERARGPLRFACRPVGTAMPRFVWARPVLMPQPGRASGPEPLVVVISLDTLRADHVPGFGAPAHWAPGLARLADEGRRFVDTTAQGTWTIPSHFALFFSRLYGLPLGEHRLANLAEALADRGYATAAFTAGGFVAASFGFGQGFDLYVEHDSAHRFGGSDLLALPELLGMVESHVDRHAQAPLFLFVHTYAVHQQTLDEVEWSVRYAAFAPLSIGPDRVAEARRLYRRLVRRTDRALRPLLDRLRRESATRPVVAVVLSDHGEAFGEHANFRHGDDDPSVTLHDEVVRVPLIVWGPGIVPPGASRRPTMLLDVGPSLLDAAGIAIPPSMVGTSLAPLWAAGDESGVVRSGGALSRGARGWALRTASRKLIVETDVLELYDLERDPGERRNVAHLYPRATAHLQHRLWKRVALLGGLRHAPGELVPGCPLCAPTDLFAFFQLVTAAQHRGMQAIEVSAETRERLQALGYVDF
jgi:arylsulfatase A-like enzyme